MLKKCYKYIISGMVNETPTEVYNLASDSRVRAVKGVGAGVYKYKDTSSGKGSAHDHADITDNTAAVVEMNAYWLREAEQFAETREHESQNNWVVPVGREYSYEKANNPW